MTKPLSSDLRERLIEAVAAGMSRRAATDRFGIAASTAVKWVRRWRDTGSNAPRSQGGDKRSDRIEAHAKEILGLVAERHDITLSEMAAARRAVRSKHGLAVPRSPRHDVQKKPRTPASRSVRTSPRKDKPGAPHRQSLIRSVLSSSMRPARRPRWPGSAGGRCAAPAAWGRPRTGIGRRGHSSAASGLAA